MASDYIGRQLLRCNRNLLILGVFVLIIPLLVIILTRRALYNAFVGPFPVDASTLQGIDDPDQRRQYYVSYHSERTFDTGMREGTRDGGMTTKFLLLPIGDRFLFAIVPLSHTGDVYEGRLENISRADARDRIEQVQANSPKLRGRLLPYQLDCVYQLRMQMCFMLGLMGILMLLGLWPISLALLRTLAPERHKTLRKIAALGDPAEVRASINEEMAEGPTVRIGRLLFTRSWLIGHRFLGADVIRLDDVVWAHKMVMRMHGAKASVQAMVRTRAKESCAVTDKEARVDEMLRLIAARVPWALVGYDPRLDQTWQSNPALLIEAVEERHRRYLQDPSAFSSPPTAEPPAPG
jgi:hypothetical protein